MGVVPLIFLALLLFLNKVYVVREDASSSGVGGAAANEGSVARVGCVFTY